MSFHPTSLPPPFTTPLQLSFTFNRDVGVDRPDNVGIAAGNPSQLQEVKSELVTATDISPGVLHGLSNRKTADLFLAAFEMEKAM